MRVEAGNGTNMYEGYNWLKNTDTTRPVQYERAEEDFNTDMIVPQYPDPNWLVEYSKSNETRPLIMSEFAHIMGNSLGNYDEYWNAIENNPKLQGGFIWEWIDQGLDTVKKGKRILAYGGDFPLEGPVNENFSDNNFCVKGVVTAYRGLTPMAVQVKKTHQFIKTTYLGN
ncbi:glycoside hydrolase family 2 TIM barrel-domain containing protein [Pedobacter sp. NJ-S-72]